ncbi:MAG: hypothetical protein L0Z53_03945, partial [Acidobacteriales bacterium]|nr:hypothetical protein [Terriglobales bacterium]
RGLDGVRTWLKIRQPKVVGLDTPLLLSEVQRYVHGVKCSPWTVRRWAERVNGRPKLETFTIRDIQHTTLKAVWECILRENRGMIATPILGAPARMAMCNECGAFINFVTTPHEDAKVTLVKLAWRVEGGLACPTCSK